MSEFNQRRDLSVGYMPHMFELDEKATAHANMLSGAQRILDFIAEYEHAPADSAQSGILDLAFLMENLEPDHETSRVLRVA